MTAELKPALDPSFLENLQDAQACFGGDLDLISNKLHHCYVAGKLGDAEIIDGRVMFRARPAPKAANANTPLTIAPIKVTQFRLQGTARIPRREFIYGRHLIRKYMSALFAPGGLGKTSLSVTDAMAMVSGKPLVGHKPVSRLRCWVINAEDPIEELERKAEATAAHFNLTAEDIGDRLFLSSGRDSDFVVATEDKNGVKIVQPIFDAIIARAKADSIDVILVDPFVSTHGVNENDNAAIQKVAKIWVDIADKLNCAIDLAHHVVKGAGEVDENSGRGAGALKDKARSVRVLNRMTAEEATKWGVPLEDRMSYFRSDLAKANLTQAGGLSEWFRFVSVPMGNGAGFDKPQDHTGVVEAWRPPSNEDSASLKVERDRQGRLSAVADVPADKLAGLKVRLAAAAYKSDPQGKPWCGEPLAEIMGLDVTKSSDAAQIKAILAAWTEMGELVVISEYDEVSRKDRKFLRPASCAT
jgi:hypothetical protein